MYYVGNIMCDPNYLEHHGVLGMKWGVRRYQNPDGTLTAAGKKRYGENGQYEYKSIGQKMAQRKYDKAASKAANSGNAKDLAKADKQRGRLEAYKQRDADRLAYAKRTSTGKAIAQHIGTKMVGFGPNSGHIYQNARARGTSRGRAIAGQLLPILGGTAIAAVGAIRAANKGQKIADAIYKSTKDLDYADMIGTIYTVKSSTAAGLAGTAAALAARRANIMRENKKKYGHAMYS